MRDIKGILFDNDGTLVDTRDIILASMRYSTRHVLGRAISDDLLMRRVGEPLIVQFEDFTDDEGERAELLRVYRAHNATIHDDMIKAFPGVAEGLARLRSLGYRMGVVTSKLGTTALHGLEITGLAEYFDCCIGAEDCARYKPEAEPVLKGCQALGLCPESCIYVGDAPVDIRAGRAAGTGTVAVRWGIFDAETLHAETPDFECGSFAQLVSFCS